MYHTIYSEYHTYHIQYRGNPICVYNSSCTKYTYTMHTVVHRVKHAFLLRVI